MTVRILLADKRGALVTVAHNVLLLVSHVMLIFNGDGTAAAVLQLTYRSAHISDPCNSITGYLPVLCSLVYSMFARLLLAIYDTSFLFDVQNLPYMEDKTREHNGNIKET